MIPQSCLGPADSEAYENRYYSEPFQYGDSWSGDYDQLFPQAPVDQLQLPSFADSTSYTSAQFDPSLTQGSTITTYFDEPSPADVALALFQCKDDPAALKQSCDDLSAPKLDLQCIGVAPEIYVNGQVARPPGLPPGDDYSTNLIPNGYARAFYGGCGLVPGVASGSDLDRLSSAGSSDPGLYSISSPERDASPTKSQPMVRGRSKGLSPENREKTAGVRSAGSCERCRIRKVPVSMHLLRASFNVDIYFLTCDSVRCRLALSALPHGIPSTSGIL